jgi:hypothetical protein
MLAQTRIHAIDFRCYEVHFAQSLGQSSVQKPKCDSRSINIYFDYSKVTIKLHYILRMALSNPVGTLKKRQNTY